MLISEAFPSKYLKAVDLHDKQVSVTMESVQLEDVGDDETKPVLYFVGKERGLCLNKTNANNIALVYGDDTVEWIGKPLILYPTMTDFQGRSTPCIRVKAPGLHDQRLAREAGVQVPAAAIITNGARHARAITPRTASLDIDDEVPF